MIGSYNANSTVMIALVAYAIKHHIKVFFIKNLNNFHFSNALAYFKYDRNDWGTIAQGQREGRFVSNQIWSILTRVSNGQFYP